MTLSRPFWIMQVALLVGMMQAVAMAAPSNCSKLSQPLNNVQCMDMGPSTSSETTTPTLCAAYCCNNVSGCGAWLFSSYTSPACWTSVGPCFQPTPAANWVGATVPTSAPYLIAAEAAADNSPVSWLPDVPVFDADTNDLPTTFVPASAAERNMWFGSSLIVNFWPLVAGPNYALRLVFLSDGPREMALNFGADTDDLPVTLPIARISVQQWDIPPMALVPVGPHGELGVRFTLQAQKGPNAIISNLTLLTSNASQPPIQPTTPTFPVLPMPHLAPIPSTLFGQPAVSQRLDGTWAFNATPDLDALAAGAAGSIPATGSIQVPGEYTLQGHRVPAYQPVLYRSVFAAPEAWSPNVTSGLRAVRVRIRFDGCYSNCSVYVNGFLAGSHLGGFTPFELDVTPYLVPIVGAAVQSLTVVVTGASSADTLASASTYASHDLGGISRKVQVFAVPEVHVAGFFARTLLLSTQHATVSVNVTLFNSRGDNTTLPAGFCATAMLAWQGDFVVSGAR